MKRSFRGLREPHNKPSYLERSSRRGCHIRLTCHYEPYYLAFDYSASGSRLSNEGLTDVLDHGSHGNDCNGRAQTQRVQTHFLIDSVSNTGYARQQRIGILSHCMKSKCETNSSFFSVIYRALCQRLSQQQAVSPKREWHHDVLRGPESDKVFSKVLKKRHFVPLHKKEI